MRGTTGPATAYDAAALTASVRRYVGVAERNLAAMEELGNQIQPLLERVKPLLEQSAPAAALDDAERVTIVYDRLVKAGLNLVKATDELSRLTSFLSGGPDSRPDLTAMSEVELRQILIEQAEKLGLRIVPAA